MWAWWLPDRYYFLKFLTILLFLIYIFYWITIKPGGDKEAPFCSVIFKRTPASPMHCNTFVKNIVTLSQDLCKFLMQSFLKHEFYWNGSVHYLFNTSPCDVNAWLTNMTVCLCYFTWYDFVYKYAFCLW